MGRVQKRVNNKNVRTLFRKDEVTLRAAQMFVEWIQGKSFVNPQAMNYVPASTRRWLDRLSDEEKARLAVITNATADVIYCQSNMWKNYEKAGSIITRTVVAYPAANERMPARLEYASRVDQRQGMVRVLDTGDFKGLRNIAIAFDRCEVEWEQLNGDVIEKIRPRGEVVVLTDFPQRTDSYETDDYTILGGPGERFIHRIEGPWIGHIVRTCIGGYHTPPNESILVNDAPTKLFGVLIELQPEEPKKLMPRQMPLLLPERTEEAVEETCEQKVELPKELDPQARARLRERIAERVAHYYRNLDDLETNACPSNEVGAEFSDIAAGNRSMQDELRDFVRLEVSMRYESEDFRAAHIKEITSFRTYPELTIRKPTILEIKKTADRICLALGIPKEKK